MSKLSRNPPCVRIVASGLATTLVFLYPAMVAIIMVFRIFILNYPIWFNVKIELFWLYLRKQKVYGIPFTGEI